MIFSEGKPVLKSNLHTFPDGLFRSEFARHKVSPDYRNSNHKSIYYIAFTATAEKTYYIIHRQTTSSSIFYPLWIFDLAIDNVVLAYGLMDRHARFTFLQEQRQWKD